MKKQVRIVLLIALVLLVALAFVGCGTKTVKLNENKLSGQYAGKTIIIHSNDTHGAVAGFSYMPELKRGLEAQGATVITVDAGDFSQGTTYVSLSKGESAISIMNEAGYDIVALGNHEFDYGYEQIMNNLKGAEFNVICSNVFKGNKTIVDENIIYEVGELKVGFFALLSPETQTKVNPGLIQGLKFSEGEELYKVAQKQVDKLRKECDVVICIAHLGVDNESIGNRSIDVYNNVHGIDFIIDGHSHTVMENYGEHQNIQQTGTQFAYIGMVIIDNEGGNVVGHRLVDTAGLTHDTTSYAMAQNLINTVEEQYGAKFAETSVFLDGTKSHVRSYETNLGDLITDSMIWSVTNETELKVSKDKVVAVTNGGGIRADIKAGDISRNDVFTVLPFGNTIAVNYVTGEELLETLEASTYCTPDSVGGFPQIAGMKIRVDTTKAFDKGDQYPGSTYCKPNSINRVTILEVNGQPFDKNETYAVVTNNFLAAGGDTYYAFKRAYDAGNGFDTSIPLDEGLVHYIQWELEGKIGDQYKEAQGRIEIVQ